jgi:hypothetical protein
LARAVWTKAARLGSWLTWVTEEDEKKGGDSDANKSEYDYRFHGKA